MFTTIPKADDQIAVTLLPIFSQTAVTTSFILLNMLVKLFHKLVALFFMLSHVLDPLPVVKYALIESQFFTINIAAPATAATAIPIGPVIVANAVPTNGANFITDPRAIKKGPNATTAPPMYTIIFCVFCDREDRKSRRLNSSHVKMSYAVFCLKNKS